MSAVATARAGLDAPAVLALQRSAGNAAVSALLLRDTPKAWGSKAGGGPADWKAKAAAATTPAERFALVKSAITGITVVDKTADCAGDAEVDPAHLVEFDAGAPTVSYDDNLNTKKNRAANAGFTKQRGKKAYVVLGPKTIEKGDFYGPVQTLNHEFDHIRRVKGGSKLTGNDDEVDTWTTSFIREFHRSYVVKEAGDKALIDDYGTYSALLGYYEKDDVDEKVRQDTVKRITEYYRATIKAHTVHDRVFKWWLYRTIQKGKPKALAEAVNTALGGLVDTTKDAKEYRQFPLAEAKGAKYEPAPSVALP
jgi:hypothetical protein